MMKRAFEVFAKVNELSNLIFMLGEQRVYGYESPIALGLKCRNNDVIRAIDAACKNCIRCNPRQQAGVLGGGQDGDSSDDTSVASA
jgi:hypothetical protein